MEIFYFIFILIRLPWLGQCGRGAGCARAAAALRC
jgi:hypothetical protein